MMNAKHLDRLQREALDGVLSEQEGFRFSRGSYYRLLDTQVLQLFMVQSLKGGHGFHVLLGLDSPVISGPVNPKQLGAYYHEFLGPAGTTAHATRWPSEDFGRAEQSFRAIKALVPLVVMPWFSANNSLRKFANRLGEEYDFIKAKLLLADGSPNEAREQLVNYRKRLAGMPSSVEVAKAQQEVERLLSKIRP